MHDDDGVITCLLGLRASDGGLQWSVILDIPILEPNSCNDVHSEVAVYLNSCFPQYHTTTALWPFFRGHPGEPVPEENFWTYGARED